MPNKFHSLTASSLATLKRIVELELSDSSKHYCRKSQVYKELKKIMTDYGGFLTLHNLMVVLEDYDKAHPISVIDH